MPQKVVEVFNYIKTTFVLHLYLINHTKKLPHRQRQSAKFNIIRFYLYFPYGTVLSFYCVITAYELSALHRLMETDRLGQYQIQSYSH